MRACPSVAAYAESVGFIPINTVITVRPDAARRNPEMPRLVLDAFREARRLYDDDIASGQEEAHMGLSLKTLKQVTGLALPSYSFGANRWALRTILAYAFEQGIIRHLVEPEELFLLADT